MRKVHALQTTRRAAKDFVRDGMPLHAAAIAFFTLLAVVPLFALVILAAGLWLGDAEGTRAWMEEGASALFGDARGDALRALIDGAVAGPSAGTLLVTLALLLFAATRLVNTLACTFNVVWDVEPEPAKGGWLALLWQRATSWATVLGAGFLLLVTLGLGSMAASLFPSDTLAWQAARVLTTLLVTWGVVCALYWKLPQAEVEVGDAVRAGGLVALLLTAGERVLAMLVGREHLEAVYGGLAAIVAALLWFYYTALVLLAGAELAHAAALVRGEAPPPTEVATRRSEAPKGDRPA